MKVTMLLADAASVADGNLDILGGRWNITGPRAWHDQACPEREARLAQPRVPREGIRREASGRRLMEITVHTTMATWLVEFATEGALGRDPGWAARQVWENIQAGQAMRGQVWESTGHDPGLAARHVWESSQAGQAMMRGQVREPARLGGGPLGCLQPGPSDPGV